MSEPSWLERAVEWVRRNRTLTVAVSTTAGAGAAALVVGGVLHVRRVEVANDALRTLNERLEQQTAAANEQRELARGREAVAVAALDDIVVGFEAELLEPADPKVRAFRSKVLAGALDHLARLDALEGLEGRRPPLARAKARYQLGRLAMLDDEPEQAEAHLAAALSAFEAARAAGGEDLAPALHGLALVHGARADLCAARQDPSGALALTEQAVATARQLAQVAPDALSTRTALALVLGRLGEKRQATGDAAGALTAFEEALGPARQSAGRIDAEPRSSEDLVAAFLRVAGAREAAGRADDARRAYEDALDRVRALVAHEPTNRRRVRLFVIAHEGLARLSGDPARAAAHLTEALERHEGLVDQDPSAVELRGMAAHLAQQLGEQRGLLGELEAADQAFSHGAGHARAILARDPEHAGARNQLVTLLVSLARVRDAGVGPAAAVPLFERALEELRALRKPDAQLRAFVEQALADARQRAGDSPLAVAYRCHEAGDMPGAAAAFAQALTDERVRADLEGGHLYNGACAAARASALAAADAGGPLREQALAYLAEDLKRRRERVASLAPGPAREAASAALQKHLTWARVEDEDLASLRGLPLFQALFLE